MNGANASTLELIDPMQIEMSASASAVAEEVMQVNLPATTNETMRMTCE